jgi:hypothetical protein
MRLLALQEQSSKALVILNYKKKEKDNLNIYTFLEFTI